MAQLTHELLAPAARRGDIRLFTAGCPHACGDGDGQLRGSILAQRPSDRSRGSSPLGGYPAALERKRSGVYSYAAMVMTESQMLPLGIDAPSFRLPDPNGKEVSLDDFPGAKAYVVVFMCNHCPFVKHLREELAEFGRWCQEHKVAMVGINSNDCDKYPDDAPKKMLEEVQDWGYTFPYLIDESQAVAKAYRAACTPDFYVFDGARKLVYRGQFDDSRPSNGRPKTGADLRGAVQSVFAGRPVSPDQKPSIGCNIKWKPGNEPPWFG
jgi:peroxiredoxin